MSDKKYTVRATCQNCGSNNTAFLPMGKPVDGHQEECSTCGCIVRFLPYKAIWDEKR